MEIKDYWRTAGPRRWLLVALPVVATAAAVPIALQQPTEYRATATVSVPSVGNDIGSVRQAVDAFGIATRSDIAVRQVSQETGVAAGDVSSGLTTEQQGSTNIVRVSYRGDSRDLAPRVARSAAIAGSVTFGGGQVERTEREVAAFRANYDRANTALATWLAEKKLINPPDDYRSTLGQINSLKSQIEISRAEGATTRVASLQKALTAAEKLLVTQSTVLPEYQRLSDEQGRASQLLKDADGRLVTVRSRSIDTSGSGITLTDATPVNRIPQIAQIVAAAALAGFALAALFLLLLELVSPRRRARRRRGVPVESGPQPASAVGPTSVGSAALESTGPGRAAREGERTGALSRSERPTASRNDGGEDPEGSPVEQAPAGRFRSR